ncbi:MAG: antitoxin Xre/MbcA/ParS toxin-binding domain-containing protein [Dermatophilaceae bacterium]
MKLILEKLRDVYTEEGIRIWLHSRNSDLGMRRPIELLEQGEIDLVLDEVDSLVGGW